MNRGGLDGATWTMDDRFTGYDAASIAARPARGRQDAAAHRRRRPRHAPSTIEACARAVTELAARGLMAMVEPLPYHREDDGSADAAQGRRRRWPARSRSPPALGTTSAYTWLKMPSCDEPEVVFAATTLPCVVLGGVPGPGPRRATCSRGAARSRQPAVRGLVVGRALLYPPDGDVARRGRRRREGAAGGDQESRDEPAPCRRHGAGGRAADVVELTPEDAGWDWTGLRVLRLAAGRAARRSRTGGAEAFVLPLAGALARGGRAPDDRPLALRPHRPRLGLRRASPTSATSVATASLPHGYRSGRRRGGAAVGAVRAAALPAGVRRRPRTSRSRCAAPAPATRQVTNFGVPGVWDHAERLICCELITPPGNWSSYPPHKHDASEPCQVVNEEIYYYRIAGADQVTPSASGFGLHRTYTGPEHEAAGLAPLDETRRGPRRRRRAGPARLPRSVRRRARATRCTT